ncbi:hypothetical protein QP439_05170, partial [Streptococcus sp. UMB1203]|uniref:hypothetical protein n=1 Tax=Streptococcus sp. UMB1203 TaxID=3046327 RepID=UPI0025528F2F
YGTFFLHKKGSIRSIGDLPTTNIIEPYKKALNVCLCVCFYITNYKRNKNIKKETKKNRKILTTISYSVILIA